MRATAHLRPAILMLAAGLFVAQAFGDATLPEYQVKAAFIYKFATYVRWPSRTGTDANAPFVIGVLGKDPFGSALDVVTRDQRVQGRPILIRKLGGFAELAPCDVVFISGSERGNLRHVFDVLRGHPVLTVSDIDQFAELGGMINLITTEDRHIRFDINKGAVERAGLKAPSQLLRLARIVETQEGGR